MILQFDPNLPTDYWFSGEKPERLIYRRNKMISLVERVERVEDIIRNVSRKDELENVSNSILKKVFDQYVIGNTKLSEIYRNETEC